MDRIFKEEWGKNIVPYLYDIIIFSKILEENTISALNKIKATELKLNPNKCKFNTKEVKILGHAVSNGRIKQDLEIVKRVKEY